MTKLLYMDTIENNYITKFEGRVIERGEDYVVLDQSIFYPQGGGQPSDEGTLEWRGGMTRVKEVRKRGVRQLGAHSLTKASSNTSTPMLQASA